MTTLSAVDHDVVVVGAGLPGLALTLALRGSYATLQGLDVYQLKTYGLELFLGKGFGPLTPYGGIGRMRSDATGTIPATSQTPEIIPKDQSDLTRYTVGLRISLGIPKLVVEATQGQQLHALDETARAVVLPAVAPFRVGRELHRGAPPLP